MTKKITDNFVKATIQLGGFLIDFAKVKRQTHLDPQGTLESDTDHTVMLAAIACAVASEMHPKYDLGKIAQYALVHDMVEVYAGDVDTINPHFVDLSAKAASEKAALAKIKLQFGGTFSWIHTTIEAYESLQDPESRFVKTIDKVMPAITQHFSGNRVVNEKFDDPVAFEDSMTVINKNMAGSYAYDQQFSLALRKAILKDIIDQKYAHHQLPKAGK